MDIKEKEKDDEDAPEVVIVTPGYPFLKVFNAYVHIMTSCLYTYLTRPSIGQD